jgi:histidine triad (HIT) family protein
MQESLFTKIITGEIPCHKVYEDERTLAFLDIHPVSAGHTLVISKKQVEFIWDLEDEDYTALMATVRKIGLRLRDVVASPYVGQLVILIFHTRMYMLCPFMTHLSCRTLWKAPEN